MWGTSLPPESLGKQLPRFNTSRPQHFIQHSIQRFPAMSFDASAALSANDPNARAVSSSCFDFLLIELVPMAERLAKELSKSENEPDDDEVRETTYFRLESLGYRVGQGLAER